MDMNLLIGALAAFLLGVAKGGIKGMGVIIVALMAFVFGAKNSIGIIVPLFIVGDILAVIYFKKYVKRKYLIQFLPAMVIGVLVAVFVGKDWDESVFKTWISAIILISVVYMFWQEYRKITISNNSFLFSNSIGFAAGFTTMVGNLAGPFANLYFLATQLPKNQIVGTSAWVFFIINIFKIPFHVFIWKTIHQQTLMTDLYLIPFVIIGFVVGTRILSLFNESNFRKFLLIVTAIGAIVSLLK